jgi:nicotinamidase-related amidase
MNKNILIIVDAQNDFITGSLANPVADERVPNIVKLIKSKDWDGIFATFDTHDNDYLNTPEGKVLPVPHCIDQTDGWCLDPRVNEALREFIKTHPNTVFLSVFKPTFGSLSLTEEIWETMDYTLDDTYDITICGFCTDICVVSNALILKADFFKTGIINVVANACAGVTPEKHEAALEVMRSCQINVI